MLIDANTKSFEVAVGAIPTIPIPWICEYSTDPATTGTTLDSALIDQNAQVILPGSSTRRLIDRLIVYNADPLSQLIIISLNSNGTRRPYFRATLAAGDSLTYERGRGFSVIDASGNAKGVVPLPFGAAKDASVLLLAKETGGNLDSHTTQLRDLSVFQAQALQLLQGILDELNNVGRQLGAATIE